LPALSRALSDETRWKIVKLLCTEGDALSLGHLAERLELSDYNASRHVRILSEASLVSIVRAGRFKHISIAEPFRQNTVGKETGGEPDLGCCCFRFRGDEG